MNTDTEEMRSHADNEHKKKKNGKREKNSKQITKQPATTQMKIMFIAWPLNHH